MRLTDAEDLWLACVCQAPKYAEHSRVTPDHLSARAAAILEKVKQVASAGWPMVTGEQLKEASAPDLRTIPRRLEIVDAPATIEMAEAALIDAWATDRYAEVHREAAKIVAKEGRDAGATWFTQELQQLEALAAGVRWQTPKEIADALFAAIRRELRGEGPPRLESGLTDIDFAVRYWRPSRMTALGGWPSQGKSTLALQLLTGLALRGTPTAMINLEDENEIPIRRQLAMLTDEIAAVQRLSQDEATEKDVHTFEQLAEQVLAKLPMHVVHAPGWPVEKVCHAIQDAVRRYGAKVISVDYLQCFNTVRRRSEELGNKARALKAAAAQVGAHLILVSQLVRPEGRDARKTVPSMFMLKESGDIENVTEYCLLVHRPQKGDDVSVEAARVIVDKGKDSGTGVIGIGWDTVRNVFTLASPDRGRGGADSGYTYDPDD